MGAGEEDFGSTPVLHLHAVRAVPEQAGAVRTAVLRWAWAVGRSREIVNDLGLAVYEALANVIEHAYPAGTVHPVLDLHAECEADMLTVVVADHGRWKPRRAGSVPSWRGARVAADREAGPRVRALPERVGHAGADASAALPSGWMNGRRLRIGPVNPGMPIITT